MRNEAYIEVRRNDEGCSATQHLDFLRDHQTLFLLKIPVERGIISRLFKLETVILLLVVIIAGYEVIEHVVFPLWGLLFQRKKKIFYGPDRLLGAIAEVKEWRQREGLILVGGEIWKAVCAVPLKVGDQVNIKKITGLTLTVSLAVPFVKD